MTACMYEIGAVARELGVSPSTLRSWERRYRTVVPTRGENGQRLYDSDQIRILRQILLQIQRGVRARAAHDAAGETGDEAAVMAVAELPPSIDAPGAARRAVDALIAEAGQGADPQFAFNLRLVASELVKNAVVHGLEGERIQLELRLLARSAELRVRNAGGRFSLKSLRGRRQGGRGFEIVEALADAWTIDTGPRGTTVTVHLSA